MSARREDHSKWQQLRLKIKITLAYKFFLSYSNS